MRPRSIAKVYLAALGIQRQAAAETRHLDQGDHRSGRQVFAPNKPALPSIAGTPVDAVCGAVDDDLSREGLAIHDLFLVRAIDIGAEDFAKAVAGPIDFVL